MYKLLTTAAVIMTVATPSIANEWTGHKDLVNNLKDTYGYLDGEAQFGTLEGEYTDNGVGDNNGQLSNFFNLVDQGVTYISLEVGTDHTITPTINKGVTFDQITTAQEELVARVNYDLFVDTDAAAFDKTKGAEYTSIKGQGLVIDGTPANGTGENNLSSNQNGGLAGVKITGLVDNVNEINNYLVDSGTSATNNQTFIATFEAAQNDGTAGTVNGIDKDGNATTIDINTGFFDQIDDLNGAIGLTTDSNGGFFGNIDAGALSETNVNDFAIPAYNSYNDIGDLTTIGYTSISAWAGGIHTVVVADGSSTITTNGSVAITDAAAGTVTVSGSTDETDGVYTLTGGVFVKG